MEGGSCVGERYPGRGSAGYSSCENGKNKRGLAREMEWRVLDGGSMGEESRIGEGESGVGWGWVLLIGEEEGWRLVM